MPYELETKTCALELKAEDATEEYPDGYVAGYASTFEKPKNHDYHGDVFALGAFDETLKLGGPDADDPTIIMKWEHWKAFGVPVEMHTDVKGLMTKGRPSATAKNKDRMVELRDRLYRGLSLGYIAHEWESLEQVTPWGEKVRSITLAEILEYSITMNPGNPNARITDVKSIEAWKRQDDGIWVPDPTNRTVAAVKTTETLAGKVLSKKNRDLVSSAVEALTATRDTLSALLEATEGTKSNTTPVVTDTTPDGDSNTYNVQALSSLRAQAQLLQLNLELNSMT